MQGYTRATVHATLTFFKVFKGHFVFTLPISHINIRIFIHTIAIYIQAHTCNYDICIQYMCVCSICGLCIVYISKFSRLICASL